jgi:hypothetical protein
MDALTENNHIPISFNITGPTIIWLGGHVRETACVEYLAANSLQIGKAASWQIEAKLPHSKLIILLGWMY